MPVQVNRLRGEITFCILRPPAGRILPTAFCSPLLFVSGNAEVTRLFRWLALLRLGFLYEKLLQLLVFSLKLPDPSSQFFNLFVTPVELFLKFGNRHAENVRYSKIPQKISFHRIPFNGPSRKRVGIGDCLIPWQPG